jgi:uncharacterized membrane protein (UPF0136 family)
MSGDGNDELPRRRLPLPGMAAVCLYLLLLAGVIILGVVSGQHYPNLYLVFAAAFITASAGLMMSFRWGWALALGAVSLLAAYNLWVFSRHRDPAPLIQGLLTLVMFLYLIRAEVRERLR